MASRRLCKLWVRNLPFTVSHQELKDHFSQFGRVIGSKVIFDHNTGFSNRYGFVDFADQASVENALKRNPQFLDGNYIQHLKMDGTLDFTLEAQFDKAAAYIASGSFDVSLSDRLYFYSRYKQATEGPCNISKPSLWDPQGRKKWDAWTSIKHLTADEARQQYIAKLDATQPHWELDVPAKRGWVSVSTMMKEDQPSAPSEKTIFDFVKENDLERIKALPPEELKKCDENLMTPLHWACDRGFLAVVCYLLDSHQDVNARDDEGQTALHYAVACSHVDVVKILLQRGADVDSKDSSGLRPIDCVEEESVRALFNI